MSALLFDLGGTYLRAGVLSPDWSVGALQKWPIESVAHGLEPTSIWRGVLARIAGFEAGLDRKVGERAPIVVSFPGPVVDRRRALQAPTVAGKTKGDLNFAAEGERGTQRRV